MDKTIAATAKRYIAFRHPTLSSTRVGIEYIYSRVSALAKFSKYLLIQLILKFKKFKVVSNTMCHQTQSKWTCSDNLDHMFKKFRQLVTVIHKDVYKFICIRLLYATRKSCKSNPRDEGTYSWSACKTNPAADDSLISVWREFFP